MVTSLVVGVFTACTPQPSGTNTTFDAGVETADSGVSTSVSATGSSATSSSATGSSATHAPSSTNESRSEPFGSGADDSYGALDGAVGNESASPDAATTSSERPDAGSPTSDNPPHTVTFEHDTASTGPYDTATSTSGESLDAATSVDTHATSNPTSTSASETVSEQQTATTSPTSTQPTDTTNPVSVDSDAGSTSTEPDATDVTSTNSPDSGATGECADEQVQTAACGLNGRGVSERECVVGVWSAPGPCVDSDVCVDAATQAGTTACGPNARGTLAQVCTSGQWVDAVTCTDADVCVDNATAPGTSVCGQNGRGTLALVCATGQWQDSTTCSDPDVCVDDDTQAGPSACGLNDRGNFEQVCLLGQWQDSAVCVDPDVCTDSDTQPGTSVCGLNGRGALEQVCTEGQWQDDSLCVDPDECTDDVTRTGTTVCGSADDGTLEQLCVTGSWQDSVNCVIEEVPPNILLIIADDLGVESSSIYPQAIGTLGAASMPNIEALANEGLTFDNAWANPVCSPTRGTIVSGLYGNRTGVLTPGDRLDPNVLTVYDYLNSAARPYDIGVFGKWHLAGVNGNEDQLDELQHVLDSGVPLFEGFVGGVLEDYFAWPLVTSAGVETAMTEYATSVITDRAIDYITARQTAATGAPWFAHVAYNAAHDPFQVPPSELHGVDVGALQPGDTATSIPVYQAIIEAMDTEIGRLLSAVDLRDTLVIYIGDNGTPSEVKDGTAPVRGSKISTYEGGIWVPMIMAGAGVTRVGQREPSIVSSVDLYATLISQAGYGISHVNDSYDITPLLSDAAASTGRQYAFSEHCSTNAFLGRHIAVRNQRYKLLRTRSTWGLYDLETDRAETTNLYNNASFASVRAELEAELARIEVNAVGGCF